MKLVLCLVLLMTLTTLSCGYIFGGRNGNRKSYTGGGYKKVYGNGVDSGDEEEFLGKTGGPRKGYGFGFGLGDVEGHDTGLDLGEEEGDGTGLGLGDEEGDSNGLGLGDEEGSYDGSGGDSEDSDRGDGVFGHRYDYSGTHFAVHGEEDSVDADFDGGSLGDNWEAVQESMTRGKAHLPKHAIPLEYLFAQELWKKRQ